MGGGDIGGIRLPSLREVADVAANVFTYGLVGVNEDDQLDAGLTSRGVEAGLRDTGKFLKDDIGKFLKDVTGATAAEEANNIAKQQIDAQKQALEEQKKQRIRDQQDRERQLSMAAKGTRTGGSTGGGVSAEQQLAGEFLGI